MVIASFEGNDCLVGIKDGHLFITAMNKCCHGNIIDQVTVWLPAELQDKLRVVNNFDKSVNKTRINLN